MIMNEERGASMKTNKAVQKKSQVLKKRRKLIFLLMYMVILPLVLIPAIYIVQYQQNKVVVFEQSKISFVNPTDLEHFSLDLELERITLPKFENGEISAQGNYRIKSTLSLLPGVVPTISDVKLDFELQCSWINCQGTFDEKAVVLGQTRTDNLAYSQVFPKNVLPFVTIEGPDLYVKITWTETVGQALPVVRHVYLVYDYNTLTETTIFN